MSQLERELVIQATDQGCEIALLENKELVEFHRDSASSSLTIGDIYWARIKKILPQMNAVFVDIGEEKEAFLHYTDLGENFPTLLAYLKRCHSKEGAPMSSMSPSQALQKEGRISDVLSINDYIPVEVLKEPMSTKGARLSSDISLAGRFLVLVPFTDMVSVSKKIPDRIERERLIEICQGIKQKNFGVIIRTVANGKTIKDIHEDYLELISKWNSICKKLENANGITRLFEEESKSNTLLRDILNDSFTKIHVNTKNLSASIRTYIEKIAPEKIDIIKLHNSPYLFEAFQLTSKIKSSFNKIIPLSSGGYIIIEKTEAMYVIDVNSGLSVAKKSNLDTDSTILKVNLEAAKEIARQLRLRDIGGIIVIDFIDSKNQDIKERIFEEMHNFMRADKASHTILPLSKFCLMQITRSRTRPQEIVNTKEECPSCLGTGKVTSVVLITETILNKLKSVIQIEPKTTIMVHPFVYAFLKRGLINLHLKWQWSLKTRFRLIQNSSLGINEFQFLDKKMRKVLGV